MANLENAQPKVISLNGWQYQAFGCNQCGRGVECVRIARNTDLPGGPHAQEVYGPAAEALWAALEQAAALQAPLRSPSRSPRDGPGGAIGPSPMGLHPDDRMGPTY